MFSILRRRRSSGRLPTKYSSETGCSSVLTKKLIYFSLLTVTHLFSSANSSSPRRKGRAGLAADYVKSQGGFGPET